MKKRPTIVDVARAAGVSTAAISYYLNGKEGVGAETKERIESAIGALGYVPDLSARSLANRRSRLIGVVIPQLEPGSRLVFSNPFYASLLSGIEHEARGRGFHVIVSGVSADGSYLELARRRNLEGIIIIGMHPDAFYDELRASQIPIVLVDSICGEHDFDDVAIDDRAGGRLATGYLLERGHRRVAIALGSVASGGVHAERLAGYRDALEAARMPFDPALVLEGPVAFDGGLEAADRALATLGRSGAVFAAADIIAVGFIKGLFLRGVRVPEDYSIVGFDDLDVARWTTPGLTTVRQDILEKGSTAVRLVAERIDGEGGVKRRIELPIGIAERESVRDLRAR
ncbi:MAG: LacI family transcriptional regulator [Treponema sp. GWB1_62_6]|nr:MAG: LacI family transcriptional regulator [Treponema sp. GWC1_61_84]OHE67903.1 MAG: LacI family transcriptional regulator [Treponema sp. GWB1_62_6]HCM25587.1 LacI family transcriptional regulator [Treponema sp.]